MLALFFYIEHCFIITTNTYCAQFILCIHIHALFHMCELLYYYLLNCHVISRFHFIWSNLMSTLCLPPLITNCQKVIIKKEFLFLNIYRFKKKKKNLKKEIKLIKNLRECWKVLGWTQFLNFSAPPYPWLRKL